MKTLKIKKKTPVISREAISKIGEAIYYSPEVDGIEIKVCFKDGSAIQFVKSEIDDELDEVRKERFKDKS